MLNVQRALAQWCSRQPRGALKALSSGSQPEMLASQDEVGLLGELQQLVTLVPKRCQAVAAEFVGAAHCFMHMVLPENPKGRSRADAPTQS